MVAEVGPIYNPAARKKYHTPEIYEAACNESE